MKMKKPAQKKKNTVNNNNQTSCQKPYMVVPYYKGLSESVKKNLQQTWGTGILQRKCYHQKPPDGPQGPESNAEKEWGHL